MSAASEWTPATAVVPVALHGYLAASGLTAGAVTGGLLFAMEGRKGKQPPPLVVSAAFAAVSSAAWAVGIVCLCLWVGIFL